MYYQLQMELFRYRIFIILLMKMCWKINQGNCVLGYRSFNATWAGNSPRIKEAQQYSAHAQLANPMSRNWRVTLQPWRCWRSAYSQPYCGVTTLLSCDSLPINPRKMWIQVRTMDGGKNVRIDDLSKLTKVEHLREKIEKYFDADPVRQRLFYRGKQVDETLYAYF